MDILERLEALHEMVAEAEVLSEAKKRDDRLAPQADIRNDEYADKIRDGYVVVTRKGDEIHVPAKGFWVHPTGQGTPVFVAVEKGVKISAGKKDLKPWARKALGRKKPGGKITLPAPDPDRQSGAKSGWKTRVTNMMKSGALEPDQVRGRFKSALKKRGGGNKKRGVRFSD